MNTIDKLEFYLNEDKTSSAVFDAKNALNLVMSSVPMTSMDKKILDKAWKLLAKMGGKGRYAAGKTPKKYLNPESGRE